MWPIIRNNFDQSCATESLNKTMIWQSYFMFIQLTLTKFPSNILNLHFSLPIKVKRDLDNVSKEPNIVTNESSST